MGMGDYEGGCKIWKQGEPFGIPGTPSGCIHAAVLTCVPRDMEGKADSTDFLLEYN